MTDPRPDLGADADRPPPVEEPPGDGPAADDSPASSAPEDLERGEPEEGDPTEGDSTEGDSAAAIEADLEVLMRERDEYLDSLRRLQADFENYRKRMLKRETEHLERAAEALVVKLLDVLDTARLAVDHGGGDAVEHLTAKLFDVLGKEGLDVIDPAGEPFDPTLHEAVAHEDGDGPPEVVDALRTGYVWRGRVLRPAMVKVKGS
jgi:molecular chaperone GrpE